MTLSSSITIIIIRNKRRRWFFYYDYNHWVNSFCTFALNYDISFCLSQASELFLIALDFAFSYVLWIWLKLIVAWVIQTQLVGLFIVYFAIGASTETRYFYNVHHGLARCQGIISRDTWHGVYCFLLSTSCTSQLSHSSCLT